MTVAGLCRYGDWRHVATGCTALVLFTTGVLYLVTKLLYCIDLCIVNITKTLNGLGWLEWDCNEVK